MDNRVAKLITDPQSLNFYAYSRNNPINLVDPSGEFWQYLIAGLAGAGVGAGVQAGVDVYNGSLSTGNWSSGNTYAAAAAGGGVTGLTLAATLNPYLAGAAGGVAQEATQQYLDTGSLNDATAIAESAALGTVTGLIPGGPKISGITSGKGSMQAVANQIKTKLGNGTIENISLTTGGKMFTVDAVNATPGAVIEATIKNTDNQSQSTGNWLGNASDHIDKNSSQ